jgi:integrase
VSGRKRPRGRKYRNLTAVGRVIYVQRRMDGKRVRFSTETEDWSLAAKVRDAWEAENAGSRAHFLLREAPTFEAMAERYLAEAAAHLAPSTMEDRAGHLAEDGPILPTFGKMRVGEIGRRDILEWYQRDVVAAGLSQSTGRNRLNTVASVMGYALDLEIIETNPVDAVRAVLRRRGRTKAGRAEAEGADRIRPIETPAGLAAFVAASAAQPGPGHLLEVMLLDSGLRLGEALGLKWGAVALGSDPSDPSRSLRIRETRARGRHVGGTKSGRERVVAMSRRLRALLLEHRMASGRPEPGELVLAGIEPSNYRTRRFAKVAKAAGLDGLTPKSLRDTFASQLLTAGVQLSYVSKQLGHSDVAVTARHYARWAGGDVYREPMRLEAGEVPADLLARMAPPATRAAARS